MGKGELYHTKKAQEHRSKADAYKKKMGHDYAIVLKANSTYLGDVSKETAAENAVKATQKKLEEDQAALAEAKNTLAEEAEKVAAKEAEAAKAKEQAEAAAAVAAASTEASADANSTELFQMEADLYEELLQLPGHGRHLLSTAEAETSSSMALVEEPDSKCNAATTTAYQQCVTVVDGAYKGCEALFNGLRL